MPFPLIMSPPWTMNFCSINDQTTIVEWNRDIRNRDNRNRDNRNRDNGSIGDTQWRYLDDAMKWTFLVVKRFSQTSNSLFSYVFE